MQTFKSGIKKLGQTTLDIEDKISVFLMQYRCTPNCTTGQSPSDLFLYRHMRTCLDLIHPDTMVTVRKYMQKFYHDQRAVDGSFSQDDPVYLQNTAGGREKWIPGVVVEQTGPVSYRVQGTDTVTFRRHGDQLRSRVTADGLDLNTDCATTDTSAQPSVIQDNMSADADPVHMDSEEVPAASETLCRTAREKEAA